MFWGDVGIGYIQRYIGVMGWYELTPTACSDTIITHTGG